MMGKGFGAVWTEIQSPHSNVRDSKIVLDSTACMDCGFYAIGTWIQNTNLPTTTNMKKKERWFTKVHTLTVVKGGWWMELLPGVFDMLQFFETVFL